MRFTLPTLLNDFLASGVWPSDRETALQQNLRSLVSPERVRLFAPEEKSIYLLSPPFRTIAQELASSSEAHLRDYWERFQALHQIVGDKALIIGDFGMGSDAPIILNFAIDPIDPPVYRLRWGAEGRTDWVRGARNFAQFASMLGLTADKSGV